MRIDPRTCQSCCRCIPLCPVGAICTTAEGVSAIDSDECVECGVCLRSAVCPSGALFQDELTWPRVLRQIFSNPVSIHPSTRVPGRGMEEMKTNDVTDRYRPGTLGFVVEVGRPGLGARFRDVEVVTRHLADAGLWVDTGSPLVPLMSDIGTGTFRPEILDEKVLSAIVSFEAPEPRLRDILRHLELLDDRIDTVYTLGVIVTGEAAGDHPNGGGMRDSLAASTGATVSSHGKTNLGLGRRVSEEVK